MCVCVCVCHFSWCAGECGGRGKSGQSHLDQPSPQLPGHCHPSPAHPAPQVDCSHSLYIAYTLISPTIPPHSLFYITKNLYEIKFLAAKKVS